MSVYLSYLSITTALISRGLSKVKHAFETIPHFVEIKGLSYTKMGNEALILLPCFLVNHTALGSFTSLCSHGIFKLKTTKLTHAAFVDERGKNK